ncbi:hypothetical protein GCM10010964_30800 [Caldovatus sediminis]|uniref:DUF1192 domain-containing protein n=1 Tax=Caldovatus sediminis TaxID=2041189 RepID=A0A8J3EDB0_9PROT|nr:DUF1192 domain-containing protein [Caldovatus sediminis]GGG40996.1 hypothetical protein GCM10010964_30800 [Caldovatus sediminis]
MFDDEEERLRRQAAASAKGRRGLEPAVLDGWSVAEMRDYVAALRAEIVRTEAAIAAREAQRGAADALFRKS